MLNLDALVGDVFDYLSETVNGPVRGQVLSTAAAGTVVVPRGQLGTLPDGRIVRCVKATKVTTTATPVPVRLQFLSPAYPAPSNFNPVASGAIVTWASPPAGIAATGTAAAAFAPISTGLPLSGIAELDHLDPNVDPYAAGAQGSTLALVLSPEVRAIAGSEHVARHTRVEIAWKIRCNLSTLAAQGARRTSARATFDVLHAALVGGNVAGGVAWLGAWTLARQAGGISSYELAMSVRTWMRGRVQQVANLPTQPFTTLGTTSHINSTGQTPDEAIADDIAIPST